VIDAPAAPAYDFTPETIAAAGGQVPFPTGTITGIDVLTWCEHQRTAPDGR
jgi:hypothetical protein